MEFVKDEANEESRLVALCESAKRQYNSTSTVYSAINTITNPDFQEIFLWYFTSFHYVLNNYLYIYSKN
jgi:hypothetical protein